MVVHTMATEVWIRNPLTCIRECAELLFPRIAWDRGYVYKMNLDPVKHAEVHYPTAVQYRLLMIGDQGAAELRRGRGMSNPYAVYPVWECGTSSIVELEEMLAHPRLPDGSRPDERGVEGQDHRVVLTRTPSARTHQGQALIGTLRDLQYEYPNSIMHLHGSYSIRTAFGSGLGSADWEPTADSSKGRVVLGSGKIIPWEKGIEYPLWIANSGYRLSQLDVARNRTMFNIRSAIWAGKYHDENIAFRVRPNKAEVVDYESTDFVPRTVNKVHGRGGSSLEPQDGDRFLCNKCSLAKTCRYFREGGVCTIPDSETAGLARYFKTSDSDQIIQGLGRLMEKNIERVDRGIKAEIAEDELDPEVTKIMKMLLDSGTRLAKLVNPALAGGTKVGVFVGGATQVGAGGGAATEKQIIANAMAELQEQGIAREDMDAEMVAQYITQKHAPKAIEVGGEQVE